MKSIKIDRVIETVVRTGETNNFYRVQIGDDVEENVWVSDFDEHKTVAEVFEYCTDNMDGENKQYLAEKLGNDKYFQFEGDHHYPIEANLVLANGGQDRYSDLEVLATVIEEVYADKFNIDIKLKAELVEFERGITIAIDWENLNEVDVIRLKARGYYLDAEASTDLLIKELNCSVQLIHNLFWKLL